MDNTNSSYWIGGGVLVLIVLIAGIWAFMPGNQGGSPTATSTDDGTGADNGVHPAGGQKPLATATAMASNTSSTTAVISGTVMPGGLVTTVWFEYGSSTQFGYRMNMPSTGAVYSSVAQVGYLTGLMAGKQYYFRLGAQNAKGLSYSGVYNFITPSK